MRKAMSDKSTIIARLRRDLLGPTEKNELLNSYPSDVYLTGILFPQKSEISQDEADQLQAEGGRDIDSNDVSQDEVSLATVKRPASAGLSFVIESESTPLINIRVTVARYEQEHKSAREEVDDNGNINTIVPWRRYEETSSIDNLSLAFASKDIDPEESGVKGLSLHIRTSQWEGRKLVTVAMINNNSLLKDYERASYEEICFFQTETIVTTSDGTSFCHRPLGASAMDEDTQMAQLIYRDVKEYAVGHTCSAEWNDGEDEIEYVKTTWIPQSKVKAMSSDGVEEFSSLVDMKTGPALSTKWLSESKDSTLIKGLRLLPDMYLQWLNSQENMIQHISETHHIQAKKHLQNAKIVHDRMISAIDMLENDPDTQIAFRLANKAIMMQRQWSFPDEPPLMWRPFQLGFILLSIESTANENHPDRSVADLLWFPTGGGKTEAYLGLIAFLLFLRRIKFGKKGAGVASFMRYTLRLLTIQQFQRAAAIICACDSLRLGHDLPDGVSVKLGEQPFSLGLWVGGDATPNKYEGDNGARSSLHNAQAHNRPDQLKYCPKHTSQKLLWTADDSIKEVIATCPDEKCLWNESPIPIYTVDDSIYRNKPSLVIGTIDKFAQVARKAETSSLFGCNTDYRSPDLIIQDELHLISGPLGTLAGLYEVAIDKLCSKEDCVPKIVASTATIRQASSQITSLFNRDTCLFPPPMLNADNSGFALKDENDAGRLYLGITTAGRSAKFALQAAAATLLQSVSSKDISDKNRDDFWTLVVYFNSLRELGGALVLMQDDVNNSLHEYGERYKESPRKLSEPLELTSRVSSTEIKDYLDQLGRNFTQSGCCDVLLASNMISVGVDVPRLGSMIVNGQPKGIAEYIQATSRVGRRTGGPGGLVLTIYNNAKSRDRSHFETFRTWHMALYREVEATSVTPFAPRAREKALHAALVILARHLVPSLNKGVSKVNDHNSQLNEFIEYIVDRAEDIDDEEMANVEHALQNFLDSWSNNSSAYKQYWNDIAFNQSLMLSAEKAAEIRSRKGTYHGRAIPTPNSMRNVEPGTLFVLEEQLR
jgi:helicase-like protein